MSDGKIVATLKAGAGYDAPWLVFSGDTPDEVAGYLYRATDLCAAASMAASVFAEIYKDTPPQVQVLNGQPVEVKQYGQTAPPQVAQNQMDQRQQPQQQAQPGYAPAGQFQPPQGAPWPNENPPAPMQAAPSCAHGQRVFKQGTSKQGKPYKMWACPNNDRNCQPEWIK